MQFDRKRNYAKTHLLLARMDCLGYSLRQVAQTLHIPYTTLWKKMNGYGEFHSSEIAGLASLLHLTGQDVQEIFLEQYHIFFDRVLV